MRYDDAYWKRGNFSMRPMRYEEDSADPNYAGGRYHGMRTDAGGRHQAAYGEYRADHARDLGGAGGPQGRYGPGGGGGRVRLGYDGNYHDRFDQFQQHHRGDMRPGGGRGGWQGARGGHGPVGHEDLIYDGDYRNDGGVRPDRQFLRQYNAQSPGLRDGGGYDRSYGWAEGRNPGGMDPARRLRPQPNRYGGYSSGGFGEGGGPNR